MTMIERPSFAFDTASAISQGARDYQEDALIADFSSGSELGFVILADGMGGHAAGDVASKIIVTEMFSELTFFRCNMDAFRANVSEALQSAVQAANACLKDHVEASPATRGMGATLVAAVIIGGQLYWISVGDSPLYLYRDGALTQLNEDHSMARTIDMMVRSGAMSEAEGSDHPDRNVLTSVLFGEPIPKIDCPAEPIQLRAGDLLIVASDGLQFLPEDQIARVLRERPLCRSGDIADALMDRLTRLNDPDLDNVSLSVIQVRNHYQAEAYMPDEMPVEPDAPSASSLLRGFASRRGKSNPENHKDDAAESPGDG